MALTKTVTYTQTQPVSLGFANEVVGTTGTVTVNIDYLVGMGKLSTGTYGASKSVASGIANYTGNSGKWTITGTLADVNAALNDLKWQPRTYPDANIVQDPRAPRAYTDYNGELVLEIYDPTDFIGQNALSFSQLTFPDATGASLEITRLVAGAVANTWLVHCIVKGRDLVDGFSQNSKLTRNTTTFRYASTSNGSVYFPIFDYSFQNPVGESNLAISVLDDGSVHDSGTVSLTGEYLVPMPTFTQNPPATLTYSAFMNNIGMGTVANSTNELIGVQLLAKRYPSDPTFDGDVATNTPSYITDNTYIKFGNVTIDNRSSKTFDDGLIRWEFYGTPSQCSQALEEVSGITTKYNNTTSYDFFLETRIITSKARVNYSRGIS